MKYFETYSSNTVAGSSNQTFFLSDGREHIGRVFYKIAHGGEYNYSLLFSNIIDSTFADGTVSYKNLICDSWEILRAGVAKADGNLFGNVFNPESSGITVNNTSLDFVPLAFNGNTAKTVTPGEFFASDPVTLSFDKNDYLCLEIAFRGKMIPCHAETLLPVFEKSAGGWFFSPQLPLAGMVGCDRPVKARIGCIGDSITQGIGTPPNSYLHWNAMLSESIPETYSLWNLGIGFARADDMASDGAWAYKAKQNDIIFVCYGVNDLYNGFSESQIIANLTKIADMLKNLGKTVIVQTVPPFDYPPELVESWKNINKYILNELSKKVDFVFDDTLCLGVSEEEPHLSKYGPHPDAAGCAVWAEKLYKALSETNLLK